MYSDLNKPDQILLAAEFVARGVSIPEQLKDELGTELVSALVEPERK